MSARHTHTRLQRMSPKTIPSVFTYQDEEDSDVDVAIQFFENEDEMARDEHYSPRKDLHRAINRGSNERLTSRVSDKQRR